MKSVSRALRGAALLAAAFLAMSGVRARAQDSAPRVFEVYWQSSRTIGLPGVSNVVVLEESICRAQVSQDKVEFAGLTRGETLAFAWVNDQRLTMRIRVVARPIDLPPPHLSNADLDALGRGYVGSSMQTSMGGAGTPGYLFLHHFEWQQQSDGTRLGIRGQVQDSTFPGAPLFNPNTVSIQYSTKRSELWLMDFPLTVNGGMDAKVSPYSAYNVYMVRGAETIFHRGANRYELFAGATIPSYFLTLEGTSDVAGFNFSRQQTDKLYMYATTGWVNSPVQGPLFSTMQRQNSFMQTAGVAYRPNLQWAAQGTVGASTQGGLAQGTLSYAGSRLSAFVSGTSSSPEFPLNQLQLLFAGGTSITAGGTLKLDSRFSGSLYFQHSSTKATPFYPVSGDSDYLNPGLSWAITPTESLTLNYNYTRNSSGASLLGRGQGQRYDVALNSRLGPRISNTAQITVGALSDPLQLNAQGQFTARDVLSVPIRSGFLTVGFEHTRNNPSMVMRLHDDLGLLSPALQQLFLLDPVGFTQSSQLPPQISALLQNLQPTDTQISVSGQFKIGSRLNLSPTVGYTQNAAGPGQKSNSNLFGYALSYQLTPSIQIVSSLSNVLLYDFRQGGVRRTTLMTIGFNKSLTGTPRWLQPFRETRRAIRGRVFRDMNVNSAFNAGEPGMAGVRVDLNTGESTRTNAQGEYELTGLKPGAYRVSVPLDQFKEAVRATGSTDVRVELLEDKSAEINFGIVNFARVMGNVFNDYQMDGNRQPDANGLRGIRLLLAGAGKTRSFVTDGTGDYELNEVAPGDYVLSVDRSTLPANFLAPEDSMPIHVEPTSTIVKDIPLRALRSIAGHVYFKAGGGNILKTSATGKSAAGNTGTVGGAGTNGAAGTSSLQPVAGVRIAIGQATTTTDAEGGFILRNLPAGNLELNLIPLIPPPPGLDMPRGRVRMPRDPIQVENATIVISNPELLKYLVPLVAAN